MAVERAFARIAGRGIGWPRRGLAPGVTAGPEGTTASTTPNRWRSWRGAGRGPAPDWAVLSLLCVAQFMVILDVSIVNVALPSIRHDLGFSPSGLQWVVNAYTLAFAGFLLLGGRAADLYGRRRVFLLGLGLFSGASLVGGLAANQSMLVAARAAQGLGGAVLSPATLTILTTTFPEGPSRARAMGAWSAVAGAGGAAGALLGGVLTDLISWRWILFVNVPIGTAAFAAALPVLADGRRRSAKGSLDVAGAVLVTAGLMALVYGIVGSETHGWAGVATLAPIGVGVLLLSWFLLHEARVARVPLMPLRLFRSRSLSAANSVMLLIAAAIFASWFFLSLYMQNVLGYSPLVAGLAFLPQTFAIIMGAQISSRLVTRTGPRPLLVVGPLISAAGLGWLSRIGADGSYLHSLFVPSVLVTLGMGLAFTPVALAATSGVPRADAGLASGVVNTTRQVGGSIGLAVLATLAANRTHAQLAAPGRHSADAAAAALVSGYRLAFVVGAAFAVAAAVAAAVGIPPAAGPAPHAAPADDPAAVAGRSGGDRSKDVEHEREAVAGTHDG